MKRLMVLILFGAILVTSAGCESNEYLSENADDNTATQTTEEREMPTNASVTEMQTESITEITQPSTESLTELFTEQPTETITSSLPTAEIVTAMEKHYDYVDRVGNAYNSVMRIPKIDSTDGVDFEDINAQIVSDSIDRISASDEEMEKQVSLTTASIDYQGYIGHDMISILVTHTFPSGGMKEFFVYNVDIHTGTLLDNDEVAEKWGISADELHEKIKTALENDYRQRYFANIETEDNERLLAQTLDEENIGQSKVFVDESGQLEIVCTEYSLAGAERYSQTVVLG